MDDHVDISKFHNPESAKTWGSIRDSLEKAPPNISVPEVNSYSAQGQAAVKALQEGLLDPACTQLDGYGPGRFSAQVRGDNLLIEGIAFATLEEYTAWLKALVENSSSVITWDKIEEDRMGVLDMADGSRLAIFLPPVARFFPTFSIRKHTAARWEADELVSRGTLDSRMLLFLQACVAAHVNMLFVGAMGSGKSTLLRALLSGAGDNERIAIVEQVPELGIDKPLVNEYIYQPTVEGMGLGEVLDFNLYNGLDRLVVGEVHLDGITKMLETMILTEGSMSTYHAYSAEQAGERMKLALQMETSNITAQTAISFVRQAVELIVVLEKLDNERKVTQITEVDWRTSSGRETLSGGDIFTYEKDRKIFKAHNSPHLGRIEGKMRKYGVLANSDWFIEREDINRFRRRTGA
jgi:pilus assembly protein CpaF